LQCRHDPSRRAITRPKSAFDAAGWLERCRQEA
jgi:hypothetical protein